MPEGISIIVMALVMNPLWSLNSQKPEFRAIAVDMSRIVVAESWIISGFSVVANLSLRDIAASMSMAAHGSLAASR